MHFNGRYFSQKVDLHDKSIIENANDFHNFDIFAFNYWNDEAKEIKYQIDDGCLIDQMLADWHSAVIGNAGVFDDAKKQTALDNLYKNNYKPTMRNITNVWRNFALNDESGTIICSYPDGVRTPAIPIPYGDECMTGFEYALAGLMLANGHIEEGKAIAKAVRDRYDGEKRNPWNEMECGSNYARSMASYALLPICSGFKFDMAKGYIGFSPILSEVGQYLWSVSDTWGTVKTELSGHTLNIYGDALSVSAYALGEGKAAKAVKADGRSVGFENRDGFAVFENNISVSDKLEIIFQ